MLTASIKQRFSITHSWNLLTKAFQDDASASSRVMAHQPAATSMFLHLPTELRLRIYGFVFKGGIVNLPSYSKESCYNNPMSARHEVLLSCRKCYDEGYDLWRSETVWEI
jgi:hypothetical protein